MVILRRIVNSITIKFRTVDHLAAGGHGRCCSNKEEDETADRDWLATSSRKRACLLSHFSATGACLVPFICIPAPGSFITRSMATISSNTMLVDVSNRSSSSDRLTFDSNLHLRGSRESDSFHEPILLSLQYLSLSIKLNL